MLVPSKIRSIGKEVELWKFANVAQWASVEDASPAQPKSSQQAGGEPHVRTRTVSRHCQAQETTVMANVSNTGDQATK